MRKNKTKHLWLYLRVNLRETQSLRTEVISYCGSEWASCASRGQWSPSKDISVAWQRNSTLCVCECVDAYEWASCRLAHQLLSVGMRCWPVEGAAVIWNWTCTVPKVINYSHSQEFLSFPPPGVWLRTSQLLKLLSVRNISGKFPLIYHSLTVTFKIELFMPSCHKGGRWCGRWKSHFVIISAVMEVYAVFKIFSIAFS